MTKPSHFLELAAIYQAGANEVSGSRGFISKALQIESFDWMSIKDAEDCKKILKNAVIEEYEESNEKNNLNLNFEVFKFFKYDWTNKITQEQKSLIIKGLIDIETDNTIWEIKCVQNLSDEHFLQLGIYAWIYQKNNILKKSFKLLNVLNGEIWEISINNLSEMMEILLNYHFRKVDNEDDDKFILNALKLVNN